MNSMISPGAQGGNIILQNSTFNRISMCGSLIRNFESVFWPSQSSTTASTFSIYQERVNIYNSMVISYLSMMTPAMPSFSTCGQPGQPRCYSIEIDGCTFTNFGVFSQALAEPFFVNDQYDLQYQGKILNLNTFDGDITIMNSNFSLNLLQIESCQVAYNIETYLSSLTSATNEFPIYGTPNVLQVKNLISIRNHSQAVYLVNNSFIANSGLKGIVYIDLNQDQWQVNNMPVLVDSNIFIANAGYFDTTVLMIRSFASDLYGKIPADGKIPCGGIQISNNYFEHNFGCTKVGGSLIDLKCIDVANSASSSDYIDYLDLANVTNIASPNEAELYNIDYSSFTSQNLVTISAANDLTMDLNILSMQNNYYLENTFGFSSALITFNGFQRVYQDNETFIRNMESFVENVQLLSTYNGIQLLVPMTSSQEINFNLNNVASQIIGTSFYSNEITYMARSLIFYSNINYLDITNSYFENNFLLETELGTFFRAQLGYFLYHYGQVNFENITVIDQQGWNNSFVLQQGWISNVFTSNCNPFCFILQQLRSVSEARFLCSIGLVTHLSL